MVASWVVFQVIKTLTEGLGLPDWFPAFALALLIVFFPCACFGDLLLRGAAR